MTDPRIYLAVDNCFASKRWTRPAEWMDLLADMGVSCVEASADNECDPLYMGREYMQRWAREVQLESARTGIRVVNLYSGHGTYATLGLAHHDPEVRDRIQNEWLKPMADMASHLDSGLGFYCHAFSDSVLQDPREYGRTEADLYARLAALAEHCRNAGVRTPGVEQMYTPHQIPWTIEGSKRLLREVFDLSRSPFYLTLDTGHQSAQSRFARPSELKIQEMAERFANDGEQSSFWLGPKSAYELFQQMVREPQEKRRGFIEQIGKEMDRYPYLFAEQADGDTYKWLEELGGYSPIVHLQQTTGTSSAHLPFTEPYNRSGIIFGEPVLRALQTAYRTSDEAKMPPKCREVYLTLEIFSGTGEMNADILKKLRDSVTYWRQYIPEDGMLLSDAVANLERK
jgi:D-erythrulose 1-phosphate 3-epimerase